LPDLPKKLARWLENGEALPHLRPVIAELLDLTKDPSATLDVLMPSLSCDPALVGHLLRQANSPVMGLSGKVTTLQLAMSLLGVDEMKRIVLSCFLNSATEHIPLTRALMRRGYWKHSVACANASWAIATVVAPYEKEECYLAGLLHDVGWLVLGACFPDELDQLLGLPGEGLEIMGLEFRMLGARHTEAGAELCRRWRFPAMITEAVEQHHTPAQARRHTVITDVVNISEAFANNMEYGFDVYEQERDPFASFSFRRLGKTIPAHKMPSAQDFSEIAEAAIKDVIRTPANV